MTVKLIRPLDNEPKKYEYTSPMIEIYRILFSTCSPNRSCEARDWLHYALVPLHSAQKLDWPMDSSTHLHRDVSEELKTSVNNCAAASLRV